MFELLFFIGKILVAVVGGLFLLGLFFMAVGYAVMYHDQRMFKKMRDSHPVDPNFDFDKFHQEWVQNMKDLDTDYESEKKGMKIYKPE
jgi:hypothetical protein